MSLSPRARWWINRVGFAFVLGGALGVLIATFAPYRYQIGPLHLSFRGVRNPLAVLIIGYLMWRTTYDGFGHWLKTRLDRIGGTSREFNLFLRNFCLRSWQLWNAWGWRQRAMLLLAVAQSVFILRVWQGYPTFLDFEREAHANMFRLAAYGDPGAELPLLEHFCQQICDSTPPTARILFHGGTPGMRLAYEVYPRRVFILPQEMSAMAEAWHAQPQLRDLRPDAHESYWHQFIPHESADPTAFIREHRIDYVATFDEYNLSRCRVEAVR